MATPKNPHYVPSLLRRSKKLDKITKLNDFIEDAKLPVETDYSYRVKTSERRKNKNPTEKQIKERRFSEGKSSVGKVLLLKETVNNWFNWLSEECKTIEGQPGPDCLYETITEDHPNYCIFGNRCIRTELLKKVDALRAGLSEKQTKKSIDDYYSDYDFDAKIETPSEFNDMENIDIDEDIF